MDYSSYNSDRKKKCDRVNAFITSIQDNQQAINLLQERAQSMGFLG